MKPKTTPDEKSAVQSAAKPKPTKKRPQKRVAKLDTKSAVTRLGAGIVLNWDETFAPFSPGSNDTAIPRAQRRAIAISAQTKSDPSTWKRAAAWATEGYGSKRPTGGPAGEVRWPLVEHLIDKAGWLIRRRFGETDADDALRDDELFLPEPEQAKRVLLLHACFYDPKFDGRPLGLDWPWRTTSPKGRSLKRKMANDVRTARVWAVADEEQWALLVSEALDTLRKHTGADGAAPAGESTSESVAKASRLLYKAEGWTQGELCAIAGFGDDKFRDIRKLAGLDDSEHGGKGAQRRYPPHEVKLLIMALVAGPFQKRREQAARWRTTLDGG